MKDVNKQTEVLAEAILFDHQLIQRITFDLIHINQGWDDEKHDYAILGQKLLYGSRHYRIIVTVFKP